MIKQMQPSRIQTYIEYVFVYVSTYIEYVFVYASIYICMYISIYIGICMLMCILHNIGTVFSFIKLTDEISL